jgi:hypothetical protein
MVVCIIHLTIVLYKNWLFIAFMRHKHRNIDTSTK